MTDTPCPPGGHPHSDRPNWSPAENIDDYLRNCDEGLEEFSQRRFSKLSGLPRTTLWRGKLLTAIPADLFDLLVQARVAKKSMISVGRFFRSGEVKNEAEHCPCCGYMLRVRGWDEKTTNIVGEWMAAQPQD